MIIQQAFELALQYHQSGRLAEAESIYRQILAADPRNADALHLLGVIAHQVGQNGAAVDLVRHAIALKPTAADFHSNLGEAFRALGQLDEAIAAYRQAIALKPNYPEAHSNLGLALKDKGQLDEAIAACRHAIVLKPNYPEAYGNLGVALHGKGALVETIAAYQQAIALKPNWPEAHNNLGLALKDKGQLSEAVAAYRQAIVLKPNYPEAHGNLGYALEHKQQLNEAIAAYRQAIALKPNWPEIHSNLGNILTERGQLDEAIAACRHAIALKPSYAEAHSNLGAALKDDGQLDEAVAAYRQAIALMPNFPEAHSNLGNALRENGQLDQAIVACRRAILIKPDYPEAHTNLGAALYENAELDEAIAAYRRAIALQPNLSVAHSNLGSALKEQGEVESAIAAYRQAIALKPGFPMAHSNLLLTLHYHPGFDARSIADEHERWNLRHAESLVIIPRPCPEDRVRTPGRRLRVGYVSPDFRLHSVAFFIENLLACHDPIQVEVFCYASVARPDAITARLRKLVPHWRDIARMSDEKVAALIRSDAVDILVDLAGHTSGNRLLVFARKPAPVQVSWLGYPNTTGMTAMDWRLTDAHADPPGMTESLHSEQLFRLPDCAWCYRPPEDAPPVSAPPVIRTGCITFGCFNSMPKINAPLLRLWSEILRAVPGSRLLLKNRSLLDAPTRQRFQTLLESSGIAPERVELAAYAPKIADHLFSYSRADIALDTFPYHGTTTTCEALWMGVPVIVLAGKTHASRVGASLLANLGLPELVAHSEDDYVQNAIGLAADLPRLAGLRQSLRPRMQASPLMDAPRFARQIEAAYRTMWQHWCEENPTSLP